MDSPPLPPHPTTIINSNTTTRRLNHSNSFNSSTRSHQTDTWDEPLPPIPSAKLRLMCSYGGHIIPRPHDKTLCYVGGKTRIVVIDRNSSLFDIHFRLSHTFLNGQKFTLKYQLPNEELDSLISVTSNEDMENMIEEHDRINPSRLRLFLFLAKPETSTSIGSLLDDAKSETWFVDALNSVEFLHRGVSDTAVVSNLLDFDSCINVEIQNDSRDDGYNFQVIKNLDQEVHLTMPDSPMVETDSSISFPSMGNLHHIENPASLRKPPSPLQPVQRKVADPYSLPSPDSKHSGGYNLQSPDSVASDSSIASGSSLSKSIMCQDPSPVANQETIVFAPQDPSILSSLQPNHQQFFHPNTQYIQHSTTGLPISSYYPMYAAQTQQAFTDQQYPMYFVPITHIADTNARPETPTLVQVPQQYFGFSQLPNPNQSQQQFVTAGTANYGFNYTHTTQTPSQYQTINTVAAALASDNTMEHIQSSQPANK